MILDETVNKRREEIIKLLERNEKIRVSELSNLLSVSEVTIRNDLKELDKEGRLERVHGGAIKSYKPYLMLSSLERIKVNEQDKRKIAQKCAELICDGDNIMLSSGTTALLFLQELSGKKDITIITNSYLLTQEFERHPYLNIIFLGGKYYPKCQFTYGDDTLEQLKKYRANKFILSADGISAEEGIFTQYYREAEVSRLMLDNAATTIVLADKSKIGRTSLRCIAPIEKIDMLITNADANEEELESLSKLGIEVLKT